MPIAGYSSLGKSAELCLGYSEVWELGGSEVFMGLHVRAGKCIGSICCLRDLYDPVTCGPWRWDTKSWKRATLRREARCSHDSALLALCD
jgi:hypothetical protein